MLTAGFRLPNESWPRRLTIQSEAYGVPSWLEWAGVNNSATLPMSVGLQVIEEVKGISSVKG